MNMEIVQPVQETELSHIEGRIERMMRHAWYETGLEYSRIRDSRMYRQHGWANWDEYTQERWNRRKSGVDDQIAKAKEIDEMTRILGVSTGKLPSSQSQAAALSKLDDPKDRATVWQRVVSNVNGRGITAKVVAAEVERFEAAKNKNWLTLAEYESLNHPGDFIKDPHLFVSVDETKTMNLVNDNIEWAAWSWNPVTGCLHNCDYCYARDLAKRIYPQEFEPSYIPERLSMPKNTREIPPRWEGDTGHKNIFTCSMADLFGKWVPVDWINAVLQTIERNPQWTFLLLTKFPIRMAEFTYPPNVWLGTSVDYQWAVERAEKAFTKIKASGFDGVCWLSCEPMMEQLTFTSLNMFDWVVMGGSSKSSQTPEYKPPFEDILHLYSQARQSGCKVYMKTNLLGERLREYPA